MWTVPQRLFIVRDVRRRRTAFSEWTPHLGHAGVRGHPGQLAQLGGQQCPPKLQHALFPRVEVG